MTDRPVPNRKTRRSIALLIAAVLVTFCVALLIVWLPYHREQVAIAEIERVGGGVHSEPGGPAWLRNTIGNRFMKVFDNVVEVNLVEAQVDDKIMEQIGRLTWLRTLSLDRTAVTDAQLQHLCHLSQLQTLSLWETGITDAGLEQLAGLTKLEILSLWGTQVTDAGLVHLNGMTHLERLNLSNTHITRDGANNLGKRLRRCRVWFDERSG